jgi:predicted DNA-binding transcriptional regulator AlpA
MKKLPKNKPATAPAPSGLMRVKDVSKRTGKARSTVYNWIATKKVKSKKIGTEVYVIVESLRRFLGDAAKEVGISV